MTALVFTVSAVVLSAGSIGDAATRDLPDQALCVNALNRERSAWDQSSMSSDDIAEAKRRNFTVRTCRELIEKALRGESKKLQIHCTGPLSDPSIRHYGSEVLAEMRRQGTWRSSGLSLDGVFKDFVWKLSNEKIYEHYGASQHQQYYRALSAASLETFYACFPGLEQLLAEKRQRIQDEENARAVAATEARKPLNRLLTGYRRYAYIKYCNEVRQGYVVVYINEVELDRARVAVKAIEDDALREDRSLDTNAIWNMALKELGGKYVDRVPCQMELNALLEQNPRPGTLEKDF